MRARFVNPLPFTADVAIARDFYRDVVGLQVLEDAGDFVRFDGGFALHDGASLLRRMSAPLQDKTPFGRANLVLYFETDDLEAAHEWIAARAVMLHPIVNENWGARVFRFFDPDGHIIEMGEP
jgi:catechol 2,3-dioxygenase-like lactoylglutathione lyase family enzyme